MRIRRRRDEDTSGQSMTDPEVQLSSARLTIMVIICVLGMLGLMELCCFAFFNTFYARFSFANLASYTIDDRSLERVKKMYDRELGWTTRHHDYLGRRPVNYGYDTTLLASFGDSFTYCDEVNDDESWQFALASQLHVDVENYGVGGYGPDQALLAFRRHAPHTAAPLVSLGFILENINRITSVYRPFQMSKAVAFLTKPRFELREGRLMLLDNPIASADQLGKLSDPRFIASLGARDPWYPDIERPVMGFPYLALAFDPRVWRSSAALLQPPDLTQQRSSYHYQWHDNNARELFFAILDNFAQEAVATGKKPLFMLMPTPPNVTQVLKGSALFEQELFRSFCSRRKVFCFDSIAWFAEKIDPAAFPWLFMPQNHLSAVGNRLFAEGLAQKLRMAGLIER